MIVDLVLVWLISSVLCLIGFCLLVRHDERNQK